MATTTNYGWVTPDDTALVKDGAAAIRTLGSSADTTTKNLNPETTLGDISFRSSSSNVNTRLGIGTAGQVLTVVGGLPAYATPAAGGGKVLQVVYASHSTLRANSTDTFADTGLTATITPTLNTSKILVLVDQNGCGKDSTNTAIGLKIVRGSTDIISLAGIAGYNNATTTLIFNAISGSFLDTPATTSATTYKTMFASYNNTASVNVQNVGAGPVGVSTSTITLLEIGA